MFSELMPVIEDIIEARQAFQKSHALAGLDLGTKTIGVALSDTRWCIASPLQTIRRQKFSTDSAALLEIFRAHQVGGIVLGLPINMNGTEGPRAQSTRAFARNFAKQTELTISFWDERLSTVAAERALLASDISRAKRRDAIDRVAAGFILQGALDRISDFV